jgi:hypothetical protein
MSDEAKKDEPDFSREESKRRMDAATERLREVFAVARMSSENDGHRLAFALLEEAMTKGSNVGMAKRRYVNNTTEDTRRDAAGIVFLLAMLSDKMQDVLAEISYGLGDRHAGKVSVELEDGYNCGNPDCPIHGKDAAKPGDYLRPDQLTMLPPEIAKGFGELIKQGLIVKHVGKSGPFGAIEMSGPKHLLKKADEIMANAQGGVMLPDAIAAETEKQPMDAHTQEISEALDRAFGRDRSHLPKKDIPLS